MLKARRLVLTATVAIASLGLVASALAGVRVPLEKVPEPAVKTIKAKYPKAEILFVDQGGTKHDKMESYEFAMKEGERKFDVGVSPDGKLFDVTEEITEKDLPAAVKEGIQKKYPGAKILQIEMITRGDGKDAKTTYQVNVKTDKGKQGVEFDSTGKQTGGQSSYDVPKSRRER